MNAVENKKEYQGLLPGSTLKMIAVITMLIDHIGASVVERGLAAYGQFTEAVQTKLPGLYFQWIQNFQFLYNLDFYVLRLIGRISFPIYCFFIAEGYLHTKNKWKYALRLAIFAVISEIPFDLAFGGSVCTFAMQNVFFTLLFGVVTIATFEWLEGGAGGRVSPAVSKILPWVSLALFYVIAEVTNIDYGGFGVVVIWGLYQVRCRLKGQSWKKQMQMTSLFGAVCFLWEITAPIGFVLTFLYNGKRGRSLKYFFYIFYPAHLLLLGLFCGWLGLP